MAAHSQGARVTLADAGQNLGGDSLAGHGVLPTAAPQENASPAHRNSLVQAGVRRPRCPARPQQIDQTVGFC